jgi:alpha-1,2-mannosyltransferase
VLWCAVQAVRDLDPDARIVVYTGDRGVPAAAIRARARERFSVAVADDVEFVFLRCRAAVEPSSHPYATLLMQSLGGAFLTAEALLRLYPDVFIDTMGYALGYPVARLLGPARVACYVHYPTVSSDMLGKIGTRGVWARAKSAYYAGFAVIYGAAGRAAEAVAVHSSWTRGHLAEIWGARSDPRVVYPPCNTRELVETIPLERPARGPRTIVSVAQFRPEKDHPKQIDALAQLRALGADLGDVRLVLVGSCRGAEDEARVAALRRQCAERGLREPEDVEFCINAPFSTLRARLAEATVGLHTMWMEHFGIGIVEYMAAGLVPVAHDSGGPRADIVVPHARQRTGFLAAEAGEFAARIAEVFRMPSAERLRIQRAARESVTERFSDSTFCTAFAAVVAPLILVKK